MVVEIKRYIWQVPIPFSSRAFNSGEIEIEKPKRFDDLPDGHRYLLQPILCRGISEGVTVVQGRATKGTLAGLYPQGETKTKIIESHKTYMYGAVNDQGFRIKQRINLFPEKVKWRETRQYK